MGSTATWNRAAERLYGYAAQETIGRDIRRMYRVELSYTYELNLIGDAAAARQTFLDGQRGSYTAASGDSGLSESV